MIYFLCYNFKIGYGRERDKELKVVESEELGKMKERKLKRIVVEE